MPRSVDLSKIKKVSANALNRAVARYEAAANLALPYTLLRWIAKMTAVEIHSVWEHYAEQRLVAALNHDPSSFLEINSIRGVKRVSSGLAYYVVRGGRRYFDFRSMSDLIDKGDRLVGKTKNPFRNISPVDLSYIDAVAAMRNYIVHGSDAALAAYKRSLRSVYGILAAPDPDEFLKAKDMRSHSPARYQTRLHGLAVVVARSIQNT